MTPDNNFSGSGDSHEPREPVFNWGLTPTEPEAPPKTMPEPEPEEPAASPATPGSEAAPEPTPPLTPPTPPLAVDSASSFPFEAESTFPVSEAGLPGLLKLPPEGAAPPPLVPPGGNESSANEPPATEALTVADLPTGVMDVSDLPTGALDVTDMPTQAFSAVDAPTQAMTPLSRRDLRESAPVDASLEGATEVLGAHSLSGVAPEDESVEHDAVGALFGEDMFVEYEDQPLVSNVPAVITRPRGPDAPRAPIPRGQLIGLSIAGGLVAALALTALFLAGTRIAPDVAPAAVVSPTPSAAPVVDAPTVGPLPAGSYLWDELLGGECVEPFESAWQTEYTVVDCAQPHAAQLLTRAPFADAVSDPYPGIEELTTRTAALCSTDAVIDFAAATAFADLAVVSSFAANGDDWSAGQRDYFCFAVRTGDDALTGSVAQPQQAAAPEGE